MSKKQRASQTIEVGVDTLEAIEPIRDRLGMSKKELVDRVLRFFTKQEPGAQLLMAGIAFTDASRVQAAALLAYEADPDHEAVIAELRRLVESSGE